MLLVAVGVLAIVAAATTYEWIRAAGRALPAATGTYVAATLGINLPDLSTLTDRFAVSPDGTIKYAWANEDYTLRAKPTEVLENLQYFAH